MMSGHDGLPGDSNSEPRTVFVYDAPYSLEGPELTVGDATPDFELWQFRDGNGWLINREAMLDYRMPVLFCCLHSVDTRVGAMQARRFEQILARFERRVMAFLVSSDMPFTQNRYSDNEMLAFLTIASDYRGVFARAFGVYLPELMFLTRSVFIADSEGVIQHAEVVSEFSHEPDYDAVINVLGELV
jgi:thiol peroxidase